jgi:secreted PhoX family phosphatase
MAALPWRDHDVTAARRSGVAGATHPCDGFGIRLADDRAMAMTTRRTFLGSALLGGAAFTAPLEALHAAVARDGAVRVDPAYGPLRPVKDEATGLPLLHLPDGFRYLSFGWAGERLDSGTPTPSDHDGMAAFPAPDGLVHLLRNHELDAGPAFSADGAYDPAAAGGTTTVLFDPARGRAVRAWGSLSGTLRNCAGGPTPWGSWLTCEETVLGPDDDRRLQRPHGYVFEVPVDGTRTPRPLAAMGRFVHEAVAVDPVTSIVYETEDARRAGLYRFVPDVPGRLAAGGRLQMLAVRGRPRADLRTKQITRVPMGVYWVDIATPDVSRPGRGQSSVFGQGRDAGGATFARLEGAWHADGRLYITSTNGGDARMGQVWELTLAADELRLVYESPGKHELNMPDNLTVSPRGGLVLCEDGTANPCVHALTREGRITRFARNNVVLRGEVRGFHGDFRDREFAGATFSPDGRWLFVNIQKPGMTLAITGPWERGPL